MPGVTIGLNTPGVTIGLAQGFPSLRRERSRRPARPGLRPASTLNMESTI
jgi:hypothetical protein